MLNLARRLLAPVCCVVAVAGSLSAHAQDYRRNSPDVPVPSVTIDPEPPTLPRAPLTDRTKERVVEVLTGIALVDTATRIKPAGLASPGIDTGSIALLSEPGFASQLTPYLGKPASLHDLDLITRTIVLYYRAKHHPLVDVTVPPQDVTAGTVQFLVSEFRAGTVRAEGNNWFSAERLVNAVHVTQGETFDDRRLLADVAWLNTNPFRHVDLEYRRAFEPRTTDIILRTTDRFPLRVYAGYDNNGTTVTGRDRINLGFNWGDAFGLDQQLSYQLSTSGDFWKKRDGADGRPRDTTFVTHSFAWQIPLAGHEQLNIFGLHQRINPRLGEDFTAPGTSSQLSARYIKPWPTSGSFSGSWQLGYDFKKTNNNLEFGGISINKTATDIHQIVIGFDAALGDRLGRTAFAVTAYLSPGGLGRNNGDRAFAASDPLAKAKYAYSQIAVSRLSPMPFGLTWIARAKAQVSTANLLPSERLGMGGVDYGRGYDEFAASGDTGVLISNEVRLPPWTLIPNDQLQLLAFLDYGNVRLRRTPIDPVTLTRAKNGTELVSSGLGLRYRYNRYLDFRADYGFQLRSLPRAPGSAPSSRGQRAQIALTVSY